MSTRPGLLTPRRRSCPTVTTDTTWQKRKNLAIAQYAYQHGGIALLDYLSALRTIAIQR